MIICEIIVHLLVIVQNNKNKLEIEVFFDKRIFAVMSVAWKLVIRIKYLELSLQNDGFASFAA